MGEKNLKIDVSVDLKRYLDWCNVNNTLSYDDLIWMDIDQVNAYLKWSEKHPEFDEEIRDLFLKIRKKRLASMKKNQNDT